MPKKMMKQRVEKVMEKNPNLSNKEIYAVVHGHPVNSDWLKEVNLEGLAFKRVKYEMTNTEFGMLLRTWRRQNEQK